MSLWRIAWKNMRQRGVASSLTVLSMALGVAVMVGVIVIHSVTVKQFRGDAEGYHLIVGGKGGDLQLVLSTVYHLGTLRYLVPYDYYREFTDGEYAGLVEVAVPYCLGDSFDPRPNADGTSERTYRVVATTPDLFDKINYSSGDDGEPIGYTFSAGENFRADHAFEAVLGSMVAARTGVKVGDKINPSHGLSGGDDKHDAFVVTGVLDPTGTANDRAVFVNLEGFYLGEGHALSEKTAESRAAPGPRGPAQIDSPRGTIIPERLFDQEGEPIEPLPEAQREVSAVLVLSNNMMGPTILTTQINKDQDRIAQAVAPARVVTQLLDSIVGPMQIILLVLTVLIIVVAAIGILVSIYNSMSERSHDIAVMRALGASRVSVLMIVLFESILLSLAGGLLGILLGHGLLAAAAPYVEFQAGVRLAFWEFDPLELAVIPSLVLLAALAGLLPAVSAYRTDVAKSL